LGSLKGGNFCRLEILFQMRGFFKSERSSEPLPEIIRRRGIRIQIVTILSKKEVQKVKDFTEKPDSLFRKLLKHKHLQIRNRPRVFRPFLRLFRATCAPNCGISCHNTPNRAFSLWFLRHTAASPGIFEFGDFLTCSNPMTCKIMAKRFPRSHPVPLDLGRIL
jgi:hypothetical protein